MTSTYIVLISIKMRIAVIFITLAITGCTRTKHEQAQLTQQNSTPPAKDSVITSDNTQQEGDLKVATFPVPTGGYGYEIFMNGNKIIYQPTIPGLPGNIGFATAEKAQKIGELVAYKIRNGQLPPSVSPEELDSLGVLK